MGNRIIQSSVLRDKRRRFMIFKLVLMHSLIKWMAMIMMETKMWRMSIKTKWMEMIMEWMRMTVRIMTVMIAIEKRFKEDHDLNIMVMIVRVNRRNLHHNDLSLAFLLVVL